MLVFCDLLNDVELFVDPSLQVEQQQKKGRVDEQQSGIDVTQSTLPPQLCGFEVLGASCSSSVPFSMM